MVYCPKCNTPNNDCNAVCSHCGYDLFSANCNSSFYAKQQAAIQHQTQEERRVIIKRTVIAVLSAILLFISICYCVLTYPQRPIPDSELTGTWRSLYSSSQWTFTSDGKMNGMTYQAKDGRLILMPGTTAESIYTYKFMYATYTDGSRQKVLVITTNGTDNILYKKS